MKLSPPVFSNPSAFSNTNADPAKAVGRPSWFANWSARLPLGPIFAGAINLARLRPAGRGAGCGPGGPPYKQLAFCFLAVTLLAAAADDDVKMLPDGPGKEVIVRTCLECHDAGSFRKKRLDQDGWTETVGQMVDQGANATAQEQTAIVEYLVHNFGPDSKVRINTAPVSEIRVVLGFTNEETKAIIAYRDEHGDFKELPDLLKVPGIDSKKVEAKKDMLAF
ncbi:MAG: helix-hairpin-helix domain-containing protein [Bryobacteraceae bacterium]|jgi:competence protein ComEA